MSNHNQLPSYFPAIPPAPPGYQWVLPINQSGSIQQSTAHHIPALAGVQQMLPLTQQPVPLQNQQAHPGTMSMQLTGRFRGRLLLPALGTQHAALPPPPPLQPFGITQEVQSRLAVALSFVQNKLQAQAAQLLLPQPHVPNPLSLPSAAFSFTAQPHPPVAVHPPAIINPALPAPYPTVAIPIHAQSQVAGQPPLVLNPVRVGQLLDSSSVTTVLPYPRLALPPTLEPKAEPIDDSTAFTRAATGGLVLARPQNLASTIPTGRPGQLFPSARPVYTEDMKHILAPFNPPPPFSKMKKKKVDGLRCLVIRRGRQKRGPSGVIVERHYQGELTEKTRDWFERRGRKPFQFVVKKEVMEEQDYSKPLTSTNNLTDNKKSMKMAHEIKREDESLE